jgi:DNA polymerase III subunit chi
MTEILFYHLKGQTPEQVLPTLLQKSLDRGWRVVVQASSEERVEALDAHLWTWRDDSFLSVRFLVDGAAMPADPAAYQRLVLLFDGEDPDSRDAARARWTEAKSAGFEVTYWRADENGSWCRES